MCAICTAWAASSSAGLVAEDPERDDDDVDAAVPADDLVEDGGVRGEVVGVELDAVHAHRAGPDQPARFVELGDASRGQHDRRPLTNRRATASPISLRPPSTRMVFATAGSVPDRGCAMLSR